MRISSRGMATTALVVIAAGASPLWASTLKGSTIHVCEDGAEWPPYSYFKRVNGQPTKEVVGLAVDIVGTIFKKAGVGLSIELLPWARCQKELITGNAYQLALNASYSELRAKTYHLSRPYYSTTNYYFYSKKVHPTGLKIEQLADLKNYKVCGLFGYNYETYGLASGSIDQGAYSFPSVIGKVHAGRCDLFLEKYQVMAGFGATGQPFLDDENLGRAPVPGMAPTQFYMMLTRSGEHADELLKLVNDGLLELETSGELGRLTKKYLP